MLPLPPETFTLQDEAPRAIHHARGPAFGRFRKPVARPDAGRDVSRIRLKEWCFQSFATDEVFCVFAVVQLGYVAQAFGYLVDRETGRRASYEALSPLGLHLSFAPSSVAGSSRFRMGAAAITSGFAHELTASFMLPMDDGSLATLDARCVLEDALALVAPLSEKRIAYTHKAAGLPASGRLHWGERSYGLQGGLATLDWTRSAADRHTRWHWASAVGRSTTGERLGINLSALVYDDAQGDSLENGVWVDGRLQVLGGVRFGIPSSPTAPWHIESRDGSGQVDLTFDPLGARSSAQNLGLVRSVFRQPYGRMTGRICGLQLREAFGVVEEHDALW